MHPNFFLMRHLHTIATLFIALLAICSCNNKPQSLYPIRVSDASCDHTAQTLTIHYELTNPTATSTTVSATWEGSWITAINTSSAGELKVSVEQNDGDTRTAKIVISSPGYITTTIHLTQYSTPPEKANHTLMFYFFGTSLSRYFKTNLEDAAIAIETGILSNNNRVVFFRQESQQNGYIGELYYDFEAQKCKERHIKDVTLTSTTIQPEKISEIISSMAGIAPAERYGIIFAGHGHGWILRQLVGSNKDLSAVGVSHNQWIPAAEAEVTRAFGESNVMVNIKELAEAIDLSQINLDYILFDACFMSNIEAIYDLRNAANYIIASPCEIMGKGFPYHRTLPYLFQEEGTKSDYVGAAESYHTYYRDEYSNSARCGSVSVIKCDEIEALAEATREVVKSAKTEYDISALQTYEGQNPHHFYDFGEWMNVVATDDTALAMFNEQLKNTIIATYTLDTFYSAYGTYGTYPINREVYSGVTTSAPSQAYPKGWRQTKWYKEVIALED